MGAVLSIHISLENPKPTPRKVQWINTSLENASIPAKRRKKKPSDIPPRAPPPKRNWLLPLPSGDKERDDTLGEDIKTVLDGGIPEESKERWAQVDDSNVHEYREHIHLFDPGFELDSFQKRAIRHVIQRETVMGCAPTAAGKTMIAYYAVANALRLKKRLYWTNPIKALSNQAFSNLRKRFDKEEYNKAKLDIKIPLGFDHKNTTPEELEEIFADFARGDTVSNFSNIGILTGDVKKHREAPVVVMTTEILHSMCVKGEDFSDVAYVVFDEAHYISDQDRGWVYEQLIEMLPNTISLVFLSASLQNDIEVANWVGRIRRKPVYVCRVKKRPIPLQYYIYTGSETNQWTDNKRPIAYDRSKPQFRQFSRLALVKGSGEMFVPVFDSKRNQVNNKKLEKVMIHLAAIAAKEHKARQADNSEFTTKNKKKLKKLVIDLEEEGKLPAIFFILSRARIMDVARELADLDLNPNEIEKNQVYLTFMAAMSRLPIEDAKHLPMIQDCLQLALRGIGMHHSGLIIPIKEVYEKLMQARPPLIKILLATETVACGVDTPTRTVVFTEPTKPDGKSRRLLYGTEKMQMAGRAGRRGFDTKGHVVFCGFNTPQVHDVIQVIPKAPEPIQSRFKVKDQVVLSLLYRKTSVSIEDLLRRSLCEGPKAHYWDLIKRIKAHINASMEIDGGQGERIAEKIRVRERILEINRKITPQIWDQVQGNVHPGDKIWILPDIYPSNSLGIPEASQNVASSDDESRQIGGKSLKNLESESSGDHQTLLPSKFDDNQPLPSPSNLAVELDKVLLKNSRLDNVVNSSQVLSPVGVDVISPGVVGQWVKIRFPKGTHSFIHQSQIVRIPSVKLKTRNLRIEVSVFIHERKVLLEQLSRINVSETVRISEVIRAEDSEKLRKTLEILRYKLSDQALYLMPLYEERIMSLTKLGFLKDGRTTRLGMCAAHILACDSTTLLIWLKWGAYPRDPVSFASVLSSLVYPAWKTADPNLEDFEGPMGWNDKITQNSLEALMKASQDIRGEDEEYRPNAAMVPAVYTWVNGGSLADASKISPDFVGNFVQVLYRVGDILRQLEECTEYLGSQLADVEEIVKEARERIRRGIVAYESIYLV